MKNKITLFVLAAFSACAFAQVSPPPKNPDFVKLDRNGDGAISRAEAKADKRVAKFFGKADMNHDGKLNEDEWLKARSMADRQKAGEYVDDSTLTAKVKAALLAEQGLPSAAISVETYHGVVQLSGFVDSEAQVKQAGQVARGVKGVKEVKNSLNVKSKP
ncbi:MAG: BON domain-containing protein [Rhodocyclaceae bacterium]|jgi:hyperosmotically inducible protein|nr:BON domain-containing protein [Rhodocyclaceae bacterium]